MDDPIFDPWGAELEGGEAPGTAPSPPRWRSRSGPNAPKPSLLRPATSSPRADPPVLPGAAPPTSVPSAPGHFAGTASFIRAEVLRRLDELAGRLRMARHDARVEDGLADSPPAVRFFLRPWRGPWTEELSPPEGLLEIALEEGTGPAVTLRTWLDTASDNPTEETTVRAGVLGGSWLDSQVLLLVERLLAKA